jgi:hypothetical protein
MLKFFFTKKPKKPVFYRYVVEAINPTNEAKTILASYTCERDYPNENIDSLVFRVLFKIKNGKITRKMIFAKTKRIIKKEAIYV